MKERAVYWWQRRGNEFYPGYPESASKIIARLENMQPYGLDKVLEFARNLQQEVRSYYPDHQELMALYGDLERQAVNCNSGLFRIGFPVHDADIALKLILRNSPSSFVVFLAESGQTFNSYDLCLNSPSFLDWLSVREQLPADLKDLRKRVADVMSDALAGHGFVFSRHDSGASFIRKTVAGVEQKIKFNIGNTRGNPCISIYAYLRCDDLVTVQKLSKIDFEEEISLHWNRLVGVSLRAEERLYVWDDILERVGFIERSLLPLLDRLDSIRAVDALLCAREFSFLNPHLVPYGKSRLVAARLVANPDYDRLCIETVRAYEERASPASVEKLHKLIAFLDGVQPGIIPVFEDDPSVPPFDKMKMLAHANKLIRGSLRDLGLRKKDVSNFFYHLLLGRDFGDVFQYVYFTFGRKDGVWGVRVGVGLRHGAAVQVGKADKLCNGSVGFRWNLFGHGFDDYAYFSTWSEFVTHIERCGEQIRRMFQGNDSAAAIRSAFYMQGSLLYSDEIFDLNKFDAYVVGRLLGGDDGEDIVARVISRIRDIEGEVARSSAEHARVMIDYALKKVAGLQPLERMQP